MVTLELLDTYTDEVSSALRHTDFEELSKIVELLYEAKDKDLTVYTAGNGGSAATASHICNDLLKGCGVCGNPGYKAECLGDSLAVVTCLANDFDYDSIYSLQLKAKAHKGDLLLVYSGSGNSENILKVVELAKEMGLLVVGFTGRDGGKLAKLCDHVLIAPTDSMEQIEDLHMIYVHMISWCLQNKLTQKYEQGGTAACQSH